MVSIGRPLLIAGLVLTEVGLWQWRMVLAARGSRANAVLLGALGAVLQITAITQVVTNVNDPLSVAAYAAGVGLGVLLGLVAGDRLTPGRVRVTITTSDPGVARRLWARGWPATAQTAEGAHGPVPLLSIAISRRSEARLHRDVADLAPDASWNADDLRPPDTRRMGLSSDRFRRESHSSRYPASRYPASRYPASRYPAATSASRGTETACPPARASSSAARASAAAAPEPEATASSTCASRAS